MEVCDSEMRRPWNPPASDAPSTQSSDFDLQNGVSNEKWMKNECILENFAPVPFVVDILNIEV